MVEKSSPRSGAVVLDVDGVLLNFVSNRRFYAGLVMGTARTLKHLSPNRKNIIENIKAFKKSKAGGLFAYLHNMSRNDETFEKICGKIAGGLNYDKIQPDPHLKKHLEQLSRNRQVIIRTDGISEIAEKAFQRLMGNDYKGRPIIISDIRDNNFQTKTNLESWNGFAEKYNIDLSKSVLIDDSKANIETAEQAMGNKGFHVTRKQPLHRILTDINSADDKERQEKRIKIEQRKQEARKAALYAKKVLKQQKGRG